MRIMGILNVTPDSFSDGGNYESVEQAVNCALKMVDEGASVIDVGGESTRPGYTAVSMIEEMNRVVPVIKAIRKKSDVTISIDTYKYEVARAAIDAGADMLNSIWGFAKDERLAELVAKTGVQVVLMHNREEPADIDVGRHSSLDKLEITPNESKYMELIKAELSRSLNIAKKHGIIQNRIWIDPGVGFGKTYEQNLTVIRHVDQLVEMGYPVLMAASRKSVIGTALDLPVDQREEGTMAISVYAAMKGCAMVRVHDVEKNARAIGMLEKIL